MTRLAVVGTGTGVGKTYVTAGVVGRLRRDGVDARAVKPLQTGYPPDDDAATVRRIVESEDAAVCHGRFEPPLAPAVAADREGADLSYERVRGDCRASLDEVEVGVLEGIGGLRVPLADGREVLDLVADLDCRAVVVARSGLGTLNHSALTVSALERRDVPVEFVVLNRYEGSDVAERTNPDVLADMVDPPVHTLPEVEEGDVVGAVERHLPALA